MRADPFPLFCFVISLSAFGLLALSVDGATAHFSVVALDYGLSVAALIPAFLTFQFVVTFSAKVFREAGKDIGPNERLQWYKTTLRAYPWLNMIVAALALIITASSFTTYKALVVGSAGYGYDAMFIAWDRMIFGGVDGWVLTHSIFDTATATMWLDFLYHPTFFPMLVLFFTSATFVGRKELRQTYMSSYLIGFVVIGMISANLLHSAGPVFDGVFYGDGSTFAPLMDRLQTQLSEGGGPVYADPIRQYLLRLKVAEVAQMGGGISAMPSLHMVFAFLWVFAGWHVSRILGVILALYAGIIWAASIHLGWHYFVDGLVSLVMIGIIWRVTGHIVGLYGRENSISC